MINVRWPQECEMCIHCIIVQIHKKDYLYFYLSLTVNKQSTAECIRFVSQMPLWHHSAVSATMRTISPPKLQGPEICCFF